MTGQEMTQLLLSTAAKNNSGIELVNQAGRYPGSWTLPVCDASVWGKNWHWDYTSEDYKDSDKFALVSADIATSEKQRTHPPCLCGKIPLPLPHSSSDTGQVHPD